MCVRYWRGITTALHHDTEKRVSVHSRLSFRTDLPSITRRADALGRLQRARCH